MCLFVLDDSQVYFIRGLFEQLVDVKEAGTDFIFASVHVAGGKVKVLCFLLLLDFAPV